MNSIDSYSETLIIIQLSSREGWGM